jgi:uncharacterized protein involved in exopolysaccharide biosynthesis
MTLQRSGRDRSPLQRLWAALREDRRLLVGSLIFAAAAILTYALVRHFRIVT